MDKAVKNISGLGYGFKDIVLMASKTPAESIGLHRIGDIETGYIADVVIVDDKLNVLKTIVSGNVIFEK
jgi:N-acetylglucosamine-6-phosphate deacetylase